MKLSVAMATCNGETFLREQLDSLAAQTRLPDELILCDDHSRDQTMEVARSFAESAPFPVVILENPQQLGYIKNFERAVGACTGDVIFLADQDDVWAPGKLARHEKAYRDRPEIGGVFSDAWVVDGDLQSLHFTLWQHLKINPSRQHKFRTGKAFDLFLKRGFCYGIMLSFRATYRDVLMPFPLNYSHDNWITLILSAFAPMDVIAEPLLKYRQHRGQLIGVGLFHKKPADAGLETVTSPREAYQEDLQRALDRLDACEHRVSEFRSQLFRADCPRLIQGRREYLLRRASIPDRHWISKLALVARELISGDYVRFGTSPKVDFLADLGRVG